MKIYALKDTKSTFQSPFVCVNRLVAMRQVKMTMNDNKVLDFNADDFQLFELGDYDEDTGAITSKVDFVENLSALKHSE